jgi:hypothetical protein
MGLSKNKKWEVGGGKLEVEVEGRRLECILKTSTILSFLDLSINF